MINNAHMALEEDIKVLSNNLHIASIRNEVLYEELHRTKMKLEHHIRWIRSSKMLDHIQKSQSSTRHGVGVQKGISLWTVWSSESYV